MPVVNAVPSLLDRLEVAASSPLAFVAYLLICLIVTYSIYAAYQLRRNQDILRGVRPLNQSQLSAIRLLFKPDFLHVPTDKRYAALRNRQLMLVALASLLTLVVLVALSVQTARLTPTEIRALLDDTKQTRKGVDVLVTSAELQTWRTKVDAVLTDWTRQADFLAGTMQQAQDLISGRLNTSEGMNAPAADYMRPFVIRLPVFLEDIKRIEDSLEELGVPIRARPEYRAAMDPVLKKLDDLARKADPTYQDAFNFALNLETLAAASQVGISDAVAAEYGRREAAVPDGG